MKRSASRWSLSASTTTLRSSPASKRLSDRPRVAGKSGPAGAEALERRSGDRERPRERDQLAELALGQAVAARALAPAAGGDPPPAVAGDPGPRVRAEPDPAGLEQAQGRDQVAEGFDRGAADVRDLAVLVDGGLVDQDDREHRRLPGRDAEPVGEARLRGNLDGVGAHDRGELEVEPGDRHLQPAQRHDHLDLALLDVEAGLDLVDRRRQAALVDREVGAADPQPAEEGEGGDLGALARVLGDADPHQLEVGAAEPGDLDRRAGGPERVELAQLAGVVVDEVLGSRLVAHERRAVAGLADVVGDLVAGVDQLAQAIGGVEGDGLQSLSNHQVAHGRRLRPGTRSLLQCKPPCRGVRGRRL